jgi:hypothetical protein
MNALDLSAAATKKVLDILSTRSGFDEWWVEIGRANQDDIKDKIEAALAAVIDYGRQHRIY